VIRPVTSSARCTAWAEKRSASTIVGVTHTGHLSPILAAADLVLSSDVLKAVKTVTREIM
jgi:aryl-alcohol dehydrogenase-like predicted oxidoreductase